MQRLKRVAEVGFVETVKAQAVVLVAESLPYWLLGLNIQYVISVSFYGHAKFEQMFDSLLQEAPMLSILSS